IWSVELFFPDHYQGLEYKFCLLSPGMLGQFLENPTIRWDKSDNRYVDLRQGNKAVFVPDIAFQDSEPLWKATGVAIPIFSLRSATGFGIGDFGDLLLLIDWAKATGMKIIQTLPVNDTTQTHTYLDSYPYNAISIYALHPLYLNLDALGTLKDAKRRNFYKQKQKELNTLPSVDYEKVDRIKWQFFREIFKQEGETVIHSLPYSEFFEANKDWLLPYAGFSAKRDQEVHADLYCFLQFHAYLQMTKARDYARQNDIILKGDIPIGISRDGVEAQTEPHYFNMHFQAGAPPDAFSTDGQIWGFPTYNWPAMEADNYQWWKKRFRKMSDYFDAYRIDHILGFFRIWQIPANANSGLDGYFSPALPLSLTEIETAGVPIPAIPALFIEDDKQTEQYHPRISVAENAVYQSLHPDEKQAFDRLHNDYFYHRHNEFWKVEAIKHLTPLVNATEMLVCGEDLGMIPQSVPDVMNQLQILSLDIERMPKVLGVEFTDLQHLPYLSVCTTSTHDMSTIRGWWQENPSQTQRYYNEVLKQDGIAPEECTPEIARIILSNHLKSPSMLTIIPLQDWLAIDEELRNPDIESERINIPANARHYWRYRMHLSLEQLLKAEKLTTQIQNLITD
ncbi:MAG: 4-alpha-glucanotransferase, partial [Candidatus Symbiothrix sp.]|nr:4-alpha-glucanotransferase [Candidatus Symbiothrix sp.]